MKKLFSIVLAVVMVLSVASMALAAFSWNEAPASDNPFGYSIEVIKYTKQTGAIGSSQYNPDKSAAAVNDAQVYFAIKLVVPDIDKGKPIRDEAEVKISFTALEGSNLVDGKDFEGCKVNIANLEPGTYYYTGVAPADDSEKELKESFKTISERPIPVFNAFCRDTDTAKVYAKVSTGRDLGTTFTYGSYKIQLATDTQVTFTDKKDGNKVIFHRDADSGKVDSVEVDPSNADAQFVVKLYGFLGITAPDIENGKVYMSNDNLKAAFGFAYKSESTATWKANSTPIILDPTVTIPKTGDNASVIGFAMIMVAVVAAAVAVKKVKA